MNGELLLNIEKDFVGWKYVWILPNLVMSSDVNTPHLPKQLENQLKHITLQNMAYATSHDVALDTSPKHNVAPDTLPSPGVEWYT